jgi:hypothetical protein
MAWGKATGGGLLRLKVLCNRLAELELKRTLEQLKTVKKIHALGTRKPESRPAR